MWLKLLLLSFIFSTVSSQTCNNFVFDLTQTTEWEHYWERCVGSGHGLLGLRSDWQNHLAIARSELGFQYIRFHGILDDDMSVLTMQGNTPYYSFYNIDVVYDYLLSIGMKPIVELSFMPEVIARDPTQTIFHYKGGTSPPKQWSSWTDLVKQFVTHLIQRYTLAEVRTWYFEVWNEPNCGFWSGTYQEYFYLLQITSDLIHSIDSQLKVGGPATCRSGLIAETLQYINNGTIKIDFISTHIYPTDFGPTNNTILKSVLTQTRNLVGNRPLFYTEYNDGLYSLPVYHDTPFAASFIVKNIVDVYGIVDLLSWWTFTDIFEEQGQTSQLFGSVNGWGLISLYTVRKPAFRAFQLLHETGNVRIKGMGETYPTVGSLATTNKTHLHIIAWNHDIPTANLPIATVCFSLSPFPVGYNKPATIRRIDANNTNTAALWAQMGSPEYPTQQQISQLQAASEFVVLPFSYTTQNNMVMAKVDIPPQGVVSLVFAI